MAHKHEDIFENRKEFQLERMILFSDAVFAIAITLLVLDLKLPEPATWEQLKGDEVNRSVAELVTRFFGFVFSFFIIAQYWVTHHRLFGFIIGFDNGLVWLNLLTLFWIVLVPFTTSLNFGYATPQTWVIYSINLSMVSVCILLMWRRISNPKLGLTYLLDDPLRLKYGKIRSGVVTLIFLSGFLALIPPLFWPAHYLFILIFPAMRIINHRYKKVVAKRAAERVTHPELKQHS